jgi:hypothetical protein
MANELTPMADGPSNGTGKELVPEVVEESNNTAAPTTPENSELINAFTELVEENSIPVPSGPKRTQLGRPKGSVDRRKRRAYGKNSKRPAVTLDELTLQQMFNTYCTTPNYSYVGRVCSVNVSTVRRYAHDLDFEGRRQKIMEEARKKADYGLEKATADSLLMLRALKGKIAEKIKNLASASLNTDSIVTDFERLVKLEQILLGGVADRTEHQLTTHEERIRKLREERVMALPGRTN